MEPELRGIAEKIIDEYLTAEQVRYFIEVIQKFKPIIKSDNDVIFGWFMGMLEARFLSIFFLSKRRTLREEELNELHQIFKSRSYEIIEVINRELMR
jgi:succinate dehydrogenase flavin-adding protein (antitoxin of CptAB toxin-antitoxin module)